MLRETSSLTSNSIKKKKKPYKIFVERNIKNKIEIFLF